MKYNQEIILKNGKKAILRNATSDDKTEVLDVFKKTHGETDFLLTYPDEVTFTPDKEAQFLQKKADSENEIEIIAIVDGKVVGTAGIESLGSKYKIKHRADFGISIIKEYWGIGLGLALTEACIKCAKDARYEQLELNAVAENKSAISLYKKVGFIEFGRNPKGYKSQIGGFQEVVHMLLDLKT